MCICLDNHVVNIDIGDFQKITAKGIHAQDKDGISVVVVDDGFVVSVAPELFGTCLDTRLSGFICRPQAKQVGSNSEVIIELNTIREQSHRLMFESMLTVGSSAERVDPNPPWHTRASKDEARKREGSQTCRRPPIHPVIRIWLSERHLESDWRLSPVPHLGSRRSNNKQHCC